MGYINSFVLTDDPEAIERGRKCGVTEFTVATRFPRAFENLAGVTVYKTVDKPSDCDYPRLFLPELTDDAITDAVAEAVLSGKSSAIIAAGALVVVIMLWASVPLNMPIGYSRMKVEETGGN